MTIAYDPIAHAFTGIEMDWVRRCREAYPHVSIDKELKRAALWLDADWPLRKKKRWERFLLNWFAKNERDALSRQVHVQAHPELRPMPPKRRTLDDEIPQADIRAFVATLANMKGMK